MQEVPDSPENAAACLCGNCPSKNDDGLVFYCARVTSPLAVTRGFCACNWCPLWSGYGLTKLFFCDGAQVADEDLSGDAGPAGVEEAT